ncbi:LLM class flavin-dependent oxidoreductase [bacterium]|nr:LLM class flavin-dependent oxidoreductase [bacterium]
MMLDFSEQDQIQIYSTCCTSKDADSASYLSQVVDVARWSEEAGCRGILVYADNGIVDPWTVSQAILANTKEISPLVAVQPVYMHPFTIAKKVASLAFLYQRRICLNMLAGGFCNDHLALDDPTPHDERYDRLVEYTKIIQGLCVNSRGITQDGKYYSVRNLKMNPPLPTELQPHYMMSGSSPAGMAAAVATGATAIQYPEATADNKYHAGVTNQGPASTGVRVGVIARATSEEAWEIAEERFPRDRRGQLTHHLAMKTSDSHWHQQLSKQKERPAGEDSPYWMRPFHTYKTFCPYLVGSYEQIISEISSYLAMGHRTFIFDIPSCQQELEHINMVFQQVNVLSQ